MSTLAYLSDLEVVHEADCGEEHATHPPSYTCHAARAVIVARGLDLAATRARLAALELETRELSRAELIEADFFAPSLISWLAGRELRRREREEP